MEVPPPPPSPILSNRRIQELAVKGIFRHIKTSIPVEAFPNSIQNNLKNNGTKYYVRSKQESRKENF